MEGYQPTPPYPGPPMNYVPGYGPPGPERGFAPAPCFAPAPGLVYQGAPVPTTVTHVITRPALSDVPGQAVCPNCQQVVVTSTVHKPGLLTWAICGGLAFFGCFLCCFIPFCLESTQDVEHLCPSCRNVIHVYKPLN